MSSHARVCLCMTDPATGSNSYDQHTQFIQVQIGRKPKNVANHVARSEILLHLKYVTLNTSLRSV
jgi:hypothetical protein